MDQRQQNKTYSFFIIHLCPWNVPPCTILPLVCACVVFVCNVTISERALFDGLKLIWIKGFRVGERKMWCVGRQKRGRIKCGQGERAGCCCFAWRGGGVCGRRSWQGAAVLPPALRQQLLRKRRRPEGAAVRLSSFSIPLFTCLPLPVSKQTHARHVQHTICTTLPHPSEWHTLVGFRRNCMCLNKHSRSTTSEFWWDVWFVLLTQKGVWGLIISPLMGIKFSSSVVPPPPPFPQLLLKDVWIYKLLSELQNPFDLICICLIWLLTNFVWFPVSLVEETNLTTIHNNKLQ